MLEKIRKFLTTKYYMLLIFVLGVIVTVTGQEFIGLISFILLISIILLITEDTVATTAPFLIACIFMLRSTDVASSFIPVLWSLIPFVISLIAHFILYKKRFCFGTSFLGIVAVAVAVTAGGLGSISAEEYFDLSNLYYVFGLGFGMVLFYIIAKACYTYDSKYNVKKTFMASLYTAGLYCCFTILNYYGHRIDEYLSTFKMPEELLTDPFRNVLAAFFVVLMPLPFYFAKKNNFHVIPATLMFVCCLMTGSRCGLLFGTLQYVIGMMVLMVFNKKTRMINFGLLSVIAVFALTHSENLAYFYSERVGEGFIAAGETRFELILAAFEDFKFNPIFGKGLGNLGNNALYNPQAFEMYWYHNMIAQIVGSLGCVGVIAYMYQFFGRISIILRGMDEYKVILGLSYLGMLMVSMVDPGEFAPVPYEVLTVLIFVVLENHYGESIFTKNLEQNSNALKD